MKIRNLFLVLIMSGGFLTTGAQDCKFYFPVETGTGREMTNFDKKDKRTGRIVQTILDKNESGGSVTLEVETVIFDDKDNEINRSELEISCENGLFKIDMSGYVSEMLQAYQTMEVELDGDNLVFPSSLSVGDALPDGQINIKVSSSGISIMNMDVSIKNRKVEAKEKITTPAGTFDCYKISYTTVSKTRLISTEFTSVEWIAENIGVVKSESYDRKGKLSGYSLLTSLSQ